MSNEFHSPLPWSFKHQEDDGYHGESTWIEDKNEDDVAYLNGKDNAEFIIRRVNNYDKLAEALKDLHPGHAHHPIHNRGWEKTCEGCFIDRVLKDCGEIE